MLRIDRIYNDDIRKGEKRVLVDRLWPRGISKERAQLDEWFKDLGPSTELRVWFNHEPDKYEQFKTRYMKELEEEPQQTLLHELYTMGEKGDLVLLFGAKETRFNQAVVLKEVLDGMHYHD